MRNGGELNIMAGNQKSGRKRKRDYTGEGR